MRRIDPGLLRDFDYRQLFASTAASQFGFHITLLAMPLVAVLALSASEFEVGLLTALTMLAFLVVGLPAGAWVDRMRRRSVLIVGDLGRAVVLASVPVAWWTGILTIWQLYLVALAFGTLTVFFDVAYQSYLPQLIGRSNLVEGNAKLESVRAVSQVAGPGSAGQLVAWLTAPVALLGNAVVLGLSVIFVARIRHREPRPESSEGTNLVREVSEGLRFVFRNPLLRPIALATAYFNLVYGGMFTAMLLIFLARDLAVPEASVGLLLSIGALGGVLGGLTARRVAAWLGQGPAIWLSPALSAPFVFLVPLAQPGALAWLAAPGLFVLSVGVVIYNVNQVSFRQVITPDRLLGRMNATIRFVVWGAVPIGALAGGVIGQQVGAQATLALAASAGCLGFLLLLLSPLRGLREMPAGPHEPEPQPAAAEPGG